ncbi:neuronal acetylcholine receptor subunit alpha-7 [Crotalus adamanteus]|uniref:Neuronal acetylcholine receptor subunit alpha-7 n=1 Tax=Crotalus adamanteus TaxID=8729 RepID=A0AAW1AVG3_CROAD
MAQSRSSVPLPCKRAWPFCFLLSRCQNALQSGFSGARGGGGRNRRLLPPGWRSPGRDGAKLGPPLSQEGGEKEEEEEEEGEEVVVVVVEEEEEEEEEGEEEKEEEKGEEGEEEEGKRRRRRRRARKKKKRRRKARRRRGSRRGKPVTWERQSEAQPSSGGGGGGGERASGGQVGGRTDEGGSQAERRARRRLAPADSVEAAAAAAAEEEDPSPHGGRVFPGCAGSRALPPALRLANFAPRRPAWQSRQASSAMGLRELSVVLILAGGLVRVSLQGEYQRKLYRELLKNYNPLERPVANDSQPLTVSFSLSLRQIMDVDEKNQVLTTNVWLHMAALSGGRFMAENSSFLYLWSIAILLNGGYESQHDS